MYDFNVLDEQLAEAMLFLRQRLHGRSPQIGLVLGSGLNPLADKIADAVHIDFTEVPHMKTVTAAGHVGRFVCGELGGQTVLAMQGRLHAYEGYTAQDVAFPIWLMHRLGIETVITTNAAGALNKSFAPGDFCAISDHINFTGRNPIVGIDPSELAERCFSMTAAYDATLRATAHTVASEKSITLHEGVYLGVLGPSFETPAEIRMFRSWGADTVAMSVVEEVIAARHVGMRVLGLSFITNCAAGLGETDTCDANAANGEAVLATASAYQDDFAALVIGILEKLS